jgi:hypothetical protein
MKDAKTPFLSAGRMLRERTRLHLSGGAVTATYEGDALIGT